MKRELRLDRRKLLKLSGAAAAAPFFARPLFAQEVITARHGLSAFGDLKYGPNFTHFDYASLDAPSGGTFNFSPPNWGYNQNVLTFNTLNSFVRTGDAPPRMGLCFDSLMARALDEPDACYGLLAESVTVSDDANSFIFNLRPQARFSDGSRLTAEDIAFTYNLFKEKGHPSLLLPLTHMISAEAVGEAEFRMSFSGEQSSRTILDIVLYPIVSKAFFTANPFDSSELNPPLGSGPYKVGRFSAGQFIEYDRAPGYWARDLPVNRGLNHFDRIRIEFYRDRNAGFEAFKKGNVTYREEFTSRVWATGYDFPALKQKKIVKREFPSEQTPAMQAWALNQRRTQFRDARVREAIGLCFDFEWTNRNIFYGAYERSQSSFERSDFKAEGLPSEAELELLDRVRDEIPDSAFGEAVMQPVSDGTGRDRKLLRKASELIADAGWKRPDRGGSQFVVNANGQRLTLEMLGQDEVFEKVYSPFVQNLRAIGIDASIRLIDSSQYQARLNDFDFDIVGIAASFGATPTGEDLLHYFHSRAANIAGTRNLPGTQSDAIDAMVEQAGRAESRQELITAMRALDRILRARHDWIPNWYAANHRVAYWDMFAFAEPKPDYGFPVEALWWYDADKAKAIGRG